MPRWLMLLTLSLFASLAVQVWWHVTTRLNDLRTEIRAGDFTFVRYYPHPGAAHADSNAFQRKAGATNLQILVGLQELRTSQGTAEGKLEKLAEQVVRWS